MSPVTETKLKIFRRGSLNTETAKEGSRISYNYKRKIVRTHFPTPHEKPTDEGVIEVNDIPIEQIKEKMLTLLSDGKTRYADEIATELRLDVMGVIEAFSQLQEEGKLFVDNDKLQT